MEMLPWLLQRRRWEESMGEAVAGGNADVAAAVAEVGREHGRSSDWWKC